MAMTSPTNNPCHPTSLNKHHPQAVDQKKNDMLHRSKTTMKCISRTALTGEPMPGAKCSSWLLARGQPKAGGDYLAMTSPKNNPCH
ncbi:hypothetical protein [Planococcus maritimus]|uniref:hypothetical protein n=1 Tax=Planococcus maritimus TaxID=192421 RepID=UPI0012EC4591|nr:hypothetical protein [Planococcus maritimus]